MPTEYTYPVIEGQNFKEFVLSCARAFCIHMKESDAKLLEDPKEDTYYQDKYKKALADQYSIKNYESEYYTYCIDTEKSRAKNEEESNIAIKRLQNIKEQVMWWIPPSVRHEELKAFMLEQLESTLDQYLPRVQSPLMTYDEYRDWKKQSDKDSIKYYKEQAEEEITRNIETAWWVKTLKDSLR